MIDLLPLNAANLPKIAQRALKYSAVDVPSYPRQLQQRICHIGIGRFHRAHQANYLHRLLQQGLADGWGLCAVGIRAADQPVLQTLQAQDGLYSLWEVDGAERKVSVIGSIMQWVDASDNAQVGIDVMADAATKIVSLTITESGYCLDSQGQLDLKHPDISHDLAQPAKPRSAAGLIVRALALRRERGQAGFTLMSCDNLIENGHQLRRTVLGFAQHSDPALAQWIEAQVSFPCSMVDRITPAPNAQMQDEFCTEWRVRDDALVMCEPWQQWILEDHFIAGRPAFEQVGVVMSSQVKAYENMKVGLLNGGHSALSHVALLCGHVLVHKALEDSTIHQWLAAYMKEVATTLPPLPGVDFAEYQASLIRRFLNPAVEDRLTRLAQDTSAKFQQTLLPPLIQRLRNVKPTPCLTAAVAFWLVYLDRLRTDATANAAYQDARKDWLIAQAASAVQASDATEFLASTLVLSSELTGAFSAGVNTHLRGLRTAGVKAHVNTLIAA